MKTTAVSHELNTGDIQVMSNLTSFIANAKRITRLEAIEGKDTAAIHLDLQVRPHSEHLPSVIGETEELDLVLNLNDAAEIGMLLIAMGLEDKSQLEIDEVFKRIFELTCELHS